MLSSNMSGKESVIPQQTMQLSTPAPEKGEIHPGSHCNLGQQLQVRIRGGCSQEKEREEEEKEQKKEREEEEGVPWKRLKSTHSLLLVDRGIFLFPTCVFLFPPS